MDENEERHKVEAWLAEAGLGLGEPWREGDTVWVDIVKPSSGKAVWPRYGRGTTELEAFRSARRRYEEEQ